MTGGKPPYLSRAQIARDLAPPTLAMTTDSEYARAIDLLLPTRMNTRLSRVTSVAGLVVALWTPLMVSTGAAQSLQRAIRVLIVTDIPVMTEPADSR